MIILNFFFSLFSLFVYCVSYLGVLKRHSVVCTLTNSALVVVGSDIRVFLMYR